MMSIQPSVAYLRLNSTPNFRYSTLTGSGITIVPSAIPQFNVFENTGAAPLFSWSNTTPIYSGFYSFSFTITGSVGFEVGKTYNVVASSYIFTAPKFDTVGTFIVSQASFDSLSGLATTNYAADINMIRGNFNTDEYTVQWRVNGVYNTGLITQYLSLYRNDGTVHFLSRAMSTAANQPYGLYDAVGSERISSGEVYIAITSGVFGSSVVKYGCLISREYSI